LVYEKEESDEEVDPTRKGRVEFFNDSIRVWILLRIPNTRKVSYILMDV